jgi:ergothioneine biosynthesis protein EgtB
MPDVSPVRWHLAHTTWFFETFVLAATPGHRPYHPQFRYLFNSYYNDIGELYPRERRGLLSRPTVKEVLDYRRHVDRSIARLLQSADAAEHYPTIRLGLHHEQQHQELILTDTLHVLSCNPLRPAYAAGATTATPVSEPGPRHQRLREFAGGTPWIGHNGMGFCFDNELPRHQVLIADFELATRPITCGEYLDFIADGGYRQHQLWLADGWDRVRSEGWQAPLYWEHRPDGWHAFTLQGMRPIDATAPVTHVSYYEADAFARWAAMRLPTEAEWEVAAARSGSELDVGRVWEWTSSPYLPYPGYSPPAGALGEYNGKFMCNQMVLRGASFATPPSHRRLSYRNFFAPAARWQFSGIRLARSRS